MSGALDGLAGLFGGGKRSKGRKSAGSVGSKKEDITEAMDDAVKRLKKKAGNRKATFKMDEVYAEMRNPSCPS